MPTHVTEVLIQCVWSSLTGGWFHDPNLSLFINTIHMYTWIFLFSLPFAIYLAFEPTFKVWIVYIASITILFIIVKSFNYQLNRMFDTNKIKLIEEAKEVNASNSKKSKRRRKLSKIRGQLSSIETEPSEIQRYIEPEDAIEMNLTSNKEKINSQNDDGDVDDAKFEHDEDRDYVINHLKNSPTTRSLFKISEESLDQHKHTKLASQFEENMNKSLNMLTTVNTTTNQIDSSAVAASDTKFTLSTIIVNAPSFQDTTVSDTKLFNKNSASNNVNNVDASSNAENVENINKVLNSGNKKHKCDKKHVRRVNSDLNQYRKNRNVAKTTGFSNLTEKPAPSMHSSSENEAKYTTKTTVNNERTRKKSNRKRAKSFNYLYNSTVKVVSAGERVKHEEKIKQRQNDDYYSNYSSTSSIVSLVNNTQAVNNTQKTNIDDLKEDFLKHKQSQDDLNEAINCLVDLDEELKAFEEKKEVENEIVIASGGGDDFKVINETTNKRSLNLKKQPSTSSSSPSTTIPSRSRSHSTNTISSSSESELSLTAIPTQKLAYTLNQKEREEYEKQGARPKIPLKSKTNRKLKKKTSRKRIVEQRKRQQKTSVKYDDEDEDDDDYCSIPLADDKISPNTAIPPAPLTPPPLPSTKPHTDEKQSSSKAAKGEKHLANDHNDTSEGAIHYFVDNDYLYRYKFDKTSFGTCELVNVNDKNFNLDEIPVEFHKYLKLDKLTGKSKHRGRNRANATSIDSSVTDTAVAATTSTNLNDFQFKPPPPPPPPLPLPSINSIMRQNSNNSTSGRIGSYPLNSALMRFYEDLNLETSASPSEFSSRLHVRHRNRNDIIARLLQANAQERVNNNNNNNDEEDHEDNDSSTSDWSSDDEDDEKIRNIKSTTTTNIDELIIDNNTAALPATTNATSTNGATSAVTRRAYSLMHRNPATNAINRLQRRRDLRLRSTNTTSSTNTSSRNRKKRSTTLNSKKKRTKYQLNLTKKLSINIPFDRQSLIEMLDNNKKPSEIVFICFLAFLVAFLASIIFTMNLYTDIELILFCFLIATCHYSLLKSCQPDSASPIHGYNNILALSRSIYFCITCSFIILLDYLSNLNDKNNCVAVKLYNIIIFKYDYLISLKSFFQLYLLFQPLLCLIGLYPQINTFLIAIIEQIDIHIFGGTSMQSLASSIVSLIRSLTLNLILSSFLFVCLTKLYPVSILLAATTTTQTQMLNNTVDQTYIGLTTATNMIISSSSSKLLNENNVLYQASKAKFSQTIQFSFYCSLCVLLSYFASRQSTNYTVIYDLIKKLVLKVINLTKNSSKNESANVNTERIDEIVENTNIDAIEVVKPTPPPIQPQKPNVIKNLLEDPLPKKLENIIKLRFESDLLISVFLFLFIFAIHVSTIFNTLGEQLNDILFIVIIVIGVINHYLLPNLRLEYPWQLFSEPFLKQKHWSKFEPDSLAKLCWYERLHMYINFMEKNFLNLLLLLSTLTVSIDKLFLKLSYIDTFTNGYLSCLFITILITKLIRYSYCEPSKQYQLYLIAYLFNKFDNIFNSVDGIESVVTTDKYSIVSIDSLLIDLFVLSIFINKLYDFYDKLSFIYVYTAPWQLPWGSAFHAFAQPLSLPHSAFLFIQIVISTLIGSPIMPLMGSAIFLLSYIRPIKFWEKNYNTKRLDNTNTRLQAQFDGTIVDNENLNSIFYEHLTRVLQHTLCGDIMLGRWGNVHAGDFYILSSDYLNCLIHIIEIGNGFLTFQLRGLEFKGTYCQQRELEAISEDHVDNKSCCCCKLGHIRGMLSFNTIFHSKWLAWKIVERKYIVDSYRIIDNDLSLIVNFYSLRRTLIDFYIKSTIYFILHSDKLNYWLNNKQIQLEIEKLNNNEATYADYDPCFDNNLDCDYDLQLKAVTYSKFCINYLKWIQYCCEKRQTTDANNVRLDTSQSSSLAKFCFLVSLACRRALITACNGNSGGAAGGVNANSTNNADFLMQFQRILRSNSSSSSSNNSIGFGIASGIGTSTGVNNSSCVGTTSANNEPDSLQAFQHGYYTLFKGDIRIQSSKDEWLFADMDILNSIIIKAVRMALRLHQDHFQFDQNDEQTLYENLIKYDLESVITYERDPIWRHAVLNNVPSLLALRHQFTEFSDQYKVVMLNKNFLSFRLIKINKECVRSFWAGQQHELIFLRNKNQERGSIQNAKQVLRNIINSSCDQPIGYPIYVSPLTTSYSSTHQQLNQVIGSELSFKGIYNFFKNAFQRIHNNCTNNCSGSSNNANNEQLGLNIVYSSRSDACQINVIPVNAANEPQQQQQQQPQAAYRRQSINNDSINLNDSLNSSNNNNSKKSGLINNLTTTAGDSLRSSIRTTSSATNKDLNSGHYHISNPIVKPNRFQTVERVTISDVNQMVNLDTLTNISKYISINILCSKLTWNNWVPRNGMVGTLYLKYTIVNDTIIPNACLNEPNSYNLCIIKLYNKYYVSIKETGIEYLQESTYL